MSTAADRAVINISPAAAVAYLTVKKALLEMEVLWDVSDSAVVEYLCAKNADPHLNPHDFKPVTHDGRSPENVHGSRFTHTGEEKSSSEVLRGCERINNSILNRKKRTDERLAHFKSHPERAKAARRARAQGQRRNKDGAV